MQGDFKPKKLEKKGKKPDAKPAKSGKAGANNTGARAFSQGLSPGQIRICIVAIISLFTIIITILIVAVASGKQQQPAQQASFVSQPALASASVADDFDKEAFSRVMTEYSGVLLEEGEDAGGQYVEETLFLGDSNTARMVNSNVGEVGMHNAIGIESMGITSVLGLRCVRFSGMADMAMPKAVALMQPRRVVINFGTNNAGMNPSNFAAAYKTAVQGIQEAWPHADIIIASVFPITQNCSYQNVKMSMVEDFNIALLELAKEMGLHFLNWSEALKDPTTGYAQSQFMSGDGVHLSEKGVQAVIEYMRSHSLEAEDRRPMPLKPIPNRLPTPEGLFPKPASSAAVASSSASSSSSSSASSSASLQSGLVVPAIANIANKPSGWAVYVANMESDLAPGTILFQTPAAGTVLAQDAPAAITVTVAVARPVSSSSAPPPPPPPPPPPSSSSVPVVSVPVIPPVESVPVTPPAESVPAPPPQDATG